MSSQLLLRRRMMMQSKKDNILTFTAEAANSSVQLTAVGAPSAVTLEYNLNGGDWLPYTVGDTISLPNVGDKVKMRGNNSNPFFNNWSNYNKFSLLGKISASGDITSLLNCVGGDVYLPSSMFLALFNECHNLIKAPNLPSTQTSNSSYGNMFANCKDLTEGPLR